MERFQNPHGEGHTYFMVSDHKEFVVDTFIVPRDVLAFILHWELSKEPPKEPKPEPTFNRQGMRL